MRGREQDVQGHVFVFSPLLSLILGKKKRADST